MEIEFNSHASISLFTPDGLLVQDPWYLGRVFNEGWALTSPPHLPDWSEVKMIWISHEHPDHLSFPTLKSIPENLRKKITILYQKHASPRMANVFKNLGFQSVRELPLNKWVTLPHGTRVYCGSIGSMDSFLAVRAHDRTVLNLNDCVIHPSHARQIRRRLGPIDFLFTQFSFANWVGNEADEVGAAQRKLQQLKTQNEIFRPRYLIPFASYIYFCNEENQRMNHWVNTPASIDKLGLQNVRFLYPGDRIGADNEIPTDSSARAFRKYEEDFARRVTQPTPTKVEREILLSSVEKRLLEFAKSRYSRKTPPLSIFVKDLDLTLEIDFAGKRVETHTGKREGTRLEMVSQVAEYYFKFPWGPSTIYISGMYRDYQFQNQGLHPFNRYQNWLSTELFSPKALKSWPRTANFFWKKRGEIYHRLASKFTASAN